MKKIMLSLLILGVIFSCGKDKNLKNEIPDNTPKNVESEEIKEENKVDEIQKYNHYVEIYNRLSFFDDDFDYYFSGAGIEEKFNKKGQDRIRFRLDQNFIDMIKKAVAEKPEMADLDKVSSELILVLEEQLKLVEETTTYYNGKDYLNDNYVKAQELHTKLLAASVKYNDIAEKFRVVFNKKALEVRDQEMKTLEKEGRVISYNKLLLLNTCEEILNEVHNQKLNGANVTTADVAKLRPLYDKLSEAIAKSQELTKDQAAMEKEGYDNSSFDSFLNQVIKFKGSTISLINRAEKQEKISESVLGTRSFLENEDGSPEQLSKIFNDVVNEYNSLNR